MTIATVKPEYRELPLALLDRPALDARIDRAPEFLDALAGDVARRGILVPLIVVCVGERYEVVDGFTRYIVAVRLNLAVVPCAIYPTKELALEGVKYSATAFHENFSPADEAIYFNELYRNECGQDVEKVAALVNRKVPYVQDRLELIEGDDAVFDALRSRSITVGVARELNKIGSEEYRRYYLRFAVRDGATIATVAGWRTQWQTLIGDAPASAPAPATPSTSAGVAPEHNPLRCHVCRKSDHRIPLIVYVHQSCLEAILEPMLASARGEAD